jgi:O-antigen biosynthesis protein
VSQPCSSFSYAPLATRDAVTAQGKFFYINEQKFLLKGVIYGLFALATHGTSFPEKGMVERDFALMVEHRFAAIALPLNHLIGNDSIF